MLGACLLMHVGSVRRGPLFHLQGMWCDSPHDQWLLGTCYS